MAKKETNEDMQLAQEGKLKALQAAMAKIEKDFGKGSIMKLGDQNIENVEVIPTGSITLDIALGVGGYPKGRIIEIYGPESSGKTTLAIHAIAEAQKQGGIAAFIDAEHAFDRFYAAKLGVDVDNLWISQPDNGEQALQIADQGGSAGTPHESGAAQAHRHHLKDQHHLYLHQPVERENRRDVWQPRDYHRRQRAEVLCLGAPGHPQGLGHQGWRHRDRQRDPREDCQEQGGTSLPQGRV